MMQALEAGGLPVYFSRSRNAVNEFHTDSTKRPNPKGLYEPSQKDMADTCFPKQHDGKAVKILVPWMSALAVHDYRVVIMRRNPEAIMDSYERVFKDYWDTASRKMWIESYPEKMVEALRQFKNRKDVASVNVVDMEDLLATPLIVFNSLGWPVSPVKAASVICAR